MERLLSLDDARSRDPHIVGAKAAGLARARSAGLPVLPGWILPVDVSTPALRIGCELVGAGSGHAAAVLALAAAPLDDGLRRDLDRVAAELGTSLIVRSSALQEADPRWAGAFATYQEVGPYDVVTAVRGCWASVFSRDALARGRAMGIAPDQVRMAVLLQPWIAFEGGGTAEVLPSGGIRVATSASPTGQVAGSAGAHVTEIGAGGDDPAGAGMQLSRAVAEIARSASRATGPTAIEWGLVEDRPFLLQVRRAPAPASAGARFPRRPTRSFPSTAERLARLATRFPAPLGDRWVLPWALAVGEIPTVGPIPVGDPPTAIAAAGTIARELTARAWRTAAAPERAADALRSALGPAPADALDRLSRLRPVDPAAAARLLGLVAGVARTLVERGVLASVDAIWRLTPAELDRAALPGAAPAPERLGRDRWEPFAFAVACANGRSSDGASASPGTGAGRLRVLEGPPDRWRPGPREVLAVSEAAAQAAPLLWNAAGVVAANGSVGAHLFEVARSLGVPAVVGVDVPPTVDGALAAVDGDAGSVWILERVGASSGRIGA